MKKYLFILFILPLMWVGCEEQKINRKPVIRTFANDSISVKFWLETSEGEKATVFLKGEDIVVCCTIENITNDTIWVDERVIYCSSDFGAIYNANNDSLIAYRLAFGPAVVEERAIAPSEHIEGQLNYPDEYSEYSSKYQHLEEGKYYTKYRLRIHNTKDWSSMDIPEFRIDFKVK